MSFRSSHFTGSSLFLAVSLLLGCTPAGPSPASDSGTAAPSGAIFTTPDAVVFTNIVPGIADFGDVVGDRTKGAHGTFVKIKKGTGTVPHFHSLAYQAVVLRGLVENPFPQNAGPTMGEGAFYSVPAKAEHITRCSKDSPTDCLTYFYQSGAFDFVADVATADPTLGKQAVFTLKDSVKYDVILPDIAQFGTVTGNRDTGPHGTFVKITKGTGTPAHTHGKIYDAIVLEGTVENPVPATQTNPVQLENGAYYQVPANAEHITRCAASSATDCLTFFYQADPFDFTPVK